jgi:hypothetical protein
MGDLDRRKHDVDVIERVLGGLQDGSGPDATRIRVIDVEMPWAGGSTHSTLELTVGLMPDEQERRRNSRE